MIENVIFIEIKKMSKVNLLPLAPYASKKYHYFGGYK